MNENMPEIAAELERRFKFTCRMCSSEDVRVSVHDGWGGTDVTVGNPGEIAFGCNSCKNNDYCVSL